MARVSVQFSLGRRALGEWNFLFLFIAARRASFLHVKLCVETIILVVRSRTRSDDTIKRQIEIDTSKEEEVEEHKQDPKDT